MSRLILWTPFILTYTLKKHKYTRRYHIVRGAGFGWIKRDQNYNVPSNIVTQFITLTAR